MAFPAICQNVEVGTMKKIETGSPAYYPVLLEDGKVLTTSSDYTGLVLTDLQNGKSRVLSSASGAGYNVRVSADKKNVIYQECSYATGKRMVGYASYALDNGVSRRLQAPQRSRSVDLGGVYAVSEDLKISVYRNGQKTVLAPNGEHRRYIWPSVSPDGKKLLYTVSGVGTYVCNIDGTSPVSLGSIRAKSVTYNWHDPDTSFVEAVLSRGDRRIADVIEEVWRRGGKLEAWGDYFSFDRWMAAMDACGVDPMFYACRERGKDEFLPWDIVNMGVRRAHLWHEREQAYKAELSPDCRRQCTGCGALALMTEGGKCDA